MNSEPSANASAESEALETELIEEVIGAEATLSPLETLRHSCAHVMAKAVQRLYPGTKVTIGPAIESGFYYDFDVKKPFNEDDLEAIEAEMKNIVKAKEGFERVEVSRSDALKMFADLGETYKVEIIEALPGDAVITLYKTGEWFDLCRGPHVENTKSIKAFKLLSVAGAYWRGDEKRPTVSYTHLTLPTICSV